MATNDKYDRQLRLWGASGQKALSETCVILVGASAAGTETLKNLVLPGVGGFVVVDEGWCGGEGTATAADDCASNFFVTEGDRCSSRSRAQIAAEHLQELNSDAVGSHVATDTSLADTDYGALLGTICCRPGNGGDGDTAEGNSNGNGKFAGNNFLVVGSDLAPPTLDRLAAACRDAKLPLVAVQSYGWFGVVRLQTPPLPLLHPRPRDSPPDLRLAGIPPAIAEVQRIADSVDLDKLDSKDHGHVPYPILLLKASARYRAERGGGGSLLPQTYAEKQAFAELVKSMSRDYDRELNFQEAVRNAYLAYTDRTLDVDRIDELLGALPSPSSPSGGGGGGGGNDGDCNMGDEKRSGGGGRGDPCSNFRALLLALRKFHDKRGRAPVAGTLPDMTSSTDSYIRLQAAYVRQADADVAELRSLLPPGGLSVGGGGGGGGEQEEEELVSTFCRNVFALDLYRPRTLAEEFDPAVGEIPDDVAEDLAMSTMEGDERPEHLPLLWYLGLVACRNFYYKHGRYPGTCFANGDGDDAWTSDVSPLQSCLVDVVKRYKLQDNDLVKKTLLSTSKDDDGGGGGDDDDFGGSDHAHELCRCGNAEIHNIASVVGGVASQEAVKIITGQYVPLDNTYVFNGIASTGAVYRF